MICEIPDYNLLCFIIKSSVMQNILIRIPNTVLSSRLALWNQNILIRTPNTVLSSWLAFWNQNILIRIPNSVLSSRLALWNPVKQILCAWSVEPFNMNLSLLLF